MQIQKLTMTDGFLVIDLPDARLAAGPTRLAPKILQDGAELLARSLTYSFASYGLQLSGGSAGINARADERDEAVGAYVKEVAALASDGSWRTWPGTGLGPEDLAPLLGDGSPRLDDPELTAAGAIAAAGDLDGVAVGLCGTGPVVESARSILSGRTTTIVDGELDVSCDVLFVAGKSGLVDHERAGSVRAKRLVPLTPVPVTAKAYAGLRRAGVTYVPDFVALAAPLLAALDPGGGDAVARVRELATALVTEGPGMWLAACGVAEAFLQTWQPALPFGRPLA